MDLTTLKIEEVPDLDLGKNPCQGSMDLTTLKIVEVPDLDLSKNPCQ
jgi:hypothetical protein